MQSLNALKLLPKQACHSCLDGRALLRPEIHLNRIEGRENLPRQFPWLWEYRRCLEIFKETTAQVHSILKIKTAIIVFEITEQMAAKIANMDMDTLIEKFEKRKRTGDQIKIRDQSEPSGLALWRT